MSGVTIAYAQLHDAEALAMLHARCLSTAWDAATFRTFLGRNTGVGLLASVTPDGEPVGFCVGTLAADEAEVLAVGVVSGQRRSGFARLLMQSFHERIQIGGGQSVFLEVSADNAAAIALYRGLGYVEVAQRAGYYTAQAGAPRQDALVMRLKLKEPV